MVMLPVVEMFPNKVMLFVPGPPLTVRVPMPGNPSPTRMLSFPAPPLMVIPLTQGMIIALVGSALMTRTTPGPPPPVTSMTLSAASPLTISAPPLTGSKTRDKPTSGPPFGAQGELDVAGDFGVTTIVPTGVLIVVPSLVELLGPLLSVFPPTSTD